MSDLLVFKSFYNADEAEGMHEFLTGKGVYCRVQARKTYFDKVYAGHTDEKDFYLLMDGKDFNRANNFLDEAITEQLSGIGPDYYLYELTDDELRDVIRKPDEWNNQDVLIARKILEERNAQVPIESAAEIKALRTKELSRPDTVGSTFLLTGYLVAIVFGPGGIIFGSILITSTKVLPNGQRVKSYTSGTINHGWYLLTVGIISTLLYVGGIISRGGIFSGR